jgi:hypothetical protein
MNTNAWKLWSTDGKPAPGTADILIVLESVLRRDPTHPGANHYYVHSQEASPNPERALRAAERLKGMMPAAGHLEHMPAHILHQVGRYEEAAEANRKGAAADLAYFARAKAPDYYTMYTGHNYQFLAYSTAMAGRQAETLDAVRNSRQVIPDSMLLAMPGLDWPLAQEYAATVRFGLWDEMLAKPAPNAKLVALTGGYLYGKGMAQAAKGRIADAQSTLAALERLSAEAPAEAAAGYNTARDVFAVAIATVRARIASAEHRTDDAIASLREAAAKEDELAFNEPSDWFFPVRHLLGTQLLAARRSAEAETVYRQDLQQNPGNGWALFGLAAALKAQNKTEQAKTVESELETAWKYADTRLTASAF